MNSSLVTIRAVAAGRPAIDEACAGCAQLGTLRALRRASVEIQGGIGCDLDSGRDFVAALGRWAAVTGVARLLREGAPALLGDIERAGARVLVIADRVAPVRTTSLEDALARTGRPVVRLDLDDLAMTEARVRQAIEVPGDDPARAFALRPRCLARSPARRPGETLQSLRRLPIARLSGHLGRRRGGDGGRRRDLQRLRALRAPVPIPRHRTWEVAGTQTPWGRPPLR